MKIIKINLYLFIFLTTNLLFSQQNDYEWWTVWGQYGTDISIKKSDSIVQKEAVFLFKLKENKTDTEKTKNAFIESYKKNNDTKLANAYKDYKYSVYMLEFICMDDEKYYYNIISIDHYNSKDKLIKKKNLEKHWGSAEKESMLYTAIFYACSKGWGK